MNGGDAGPAHRSSGSGPRRARRALALAGRSSVLVARSWFPLLRTLIAAFALLGALAIPLWIWAGVAVNAAGVDGTARLSTTKAVVLTVIVSGPALIALVAVLLATGGAVTVVLGDVARGRRPGAIRAMWHGVRATPRLALTVVPLALVVTALALAAPVLVVVGLVVALATAVGRRLAPARHWPSWRTVITMIIPFGPAVAVLVHWSMVPAVVLLERVKPSAARRRARALTTPRATDMAVAMVAVGGGALLIGWSLVGHLAAGTTETTQDLITAALQVLALTIVFAIVVVVFLDGGGQPAPAPSPPSPTTGLATLVLLALIAGLVPALTLLPATPAGATVPGATIVVNDLGDADDAAPDGVCATSTGVCTLRAAITEANTSIDEVIGFAVAGTIHVGSQLHLQQPVTIDGTGSPITVDGGGTTNVFLVQMEIAGGGYGSIRNLTIANGRDASTGGSAIANNGTPRGFVLDGVTVRDNVVPASALFGGSVLNTSALTVRNSTFAGNASDPSHDGSDVSNLFSGTVTIESSTFTGSTGSSAVHSDGESASITGSLVTGAAFACSGTFTGAGNVTTDASPICPGTVTTVGQLALQPLGANGGDTPTVRLGAGSAAIDAGGTVCSLADQRGGTRPLGTACDAGAYEFDPATTTSFTATPSSATYGQAVTLDASVSATTEPGVPTGSFVFADGTTTLGTVPVDGSGAASLSVATLAAGSRSISATFQPTASFATSSAVASTTVSRASTTATITSSPNPSSGGATVTLAIDVVGAHATKLSGAVTIADGATSLGASPLDVDGHASITTSALGGGPHSITATYGGDANHLGVTSSALTHNVVGGSTTTVTPPPAATTFGNPASFSVTVTPVGGGAAPTGTVSLDRDGTPVGTATLDGTGHATVATSNLPPGPSSLTATYSGDAYNGSSTSSAVTHTVTAAPTSTALTVSPSSSIVFGNLVTLTATVTAPTSAAAPTGSVSFYDGTTLFAMGTVEAGVATFSTSELGSATYALRAEYGPGPGFVASSSSPVAYGVNAASTSVSLSASSPTSVHGQSVTLTATVTATGTAQKATGAVTFLDGGTVLGTGTLDGSGQATLATGTIATGARTITAQFGGSTNFSGSTSAGLAHTVARASTSIAVTDGTDPSGFGSPVVVDVTVATVAPGAGTPTGTVTVWDGSTSVGTATLDGAGDATITIASLPVGTHLLAVTYDGDHDVAPSSTTITRTVVPGTATVTITSSHPTSSFTQSVTFTATVASGTGTPTGTVTFRDGSTVLGTGTLDGSGVARLTTTALRAGTYLVSADYGGDGGYGSGSGSTSQTVNAVATTTTLTADDPTPTIYDVVTLTATVTGTGTSTPPSGTVTFFDGSTALGTASVDGTGRATLSQAYHRAVHTLTARFNGGGGWLTSTSASLELIPDRAPSVLTLTASPTPVTVGSTVTWTATIATSPLGSAPTGAVGFFDGSILLGTASVSGGVATFTAPAPTTLSTWTVRASYEGDTDHEPGNAEPVSVVVAAAPTTTTVVVAPSNTAWEPVVLQAQVMSTYHGSTTAGQVRFSVDSPDFSPLVATVDDSGTAQITVTDLPVGAWTVTATFEPSVSSVFASSTGSAGTTVLGRSALLTLTAPPTAVVGVPFDVTFAVADTNPDGPTPHGDVTVVAGSASCSATATAGRCRLTLVDGGPVEINASYSGDSLHTGATAGATITVGRGASSVTAWTPTTTWVTGDPISITWRVDGPRTGQVAVSTPFGEVCRSEVLDLGSCTITLPFGLRGQTVPVDVTFAGDTAWQASAATVSGTLAGCYPVEIAVRPEGAGSITQPSDGNCNGGSGYVEGTRVSVTAQPNSGYTFDSWAEDGSTARARSFVVGETSRSATALMHQACVEVRLATGVQVDAGSSQRGAGAVLATDPNCPGELNAFRPDPESGDRVGWFVAGTDVTFTAAPLRRDLDELKAWVVDGTFTRTEDTNLELTVRSDVRVEGRFGIQCVRPKIAADADGGGTAEIFTYATCQDSTGFAYERGSRIGVRILPDPYHWLTSYGDRPPVNEIVAPYRAPDTLVDTEQHNAWYDATPGLTVELTFATCARLTTDTGELGTVTAITQPNCRTRLAHEGPWYDPGTAVTLRAVPNPESTRSASEPKSGGGWESKRVRVVPRFLRWHDTDGPGASPTGGISTDPQQALFVLDVDRTVKVDFYDEGRCRILSTDVHPEGALDVTTKVGGIPCPDGTADLADPTKLDLDARLTTPSNAKVGWTVLTSDVETGQDVVYTVRQPQASIWALSLTRVNAYACVVVHPEMKLIAPDQSEQVGAPPPGSDFVVADKDPDCPVWENGFTVGTQLNLGALAPPEGYEFDHWEGDVNGTDPGLELTLDGSKPDLTVRAVYRVRCVVVTFEPVQRMADVSPESNCPTWDGQASTVGNRTDQTATDTAMFGHPLKPNDRAYIGGTPLLLSALSWNDHDFTGWGEGVLDGPAMIEAFHNGGLDDLATLTSSMEHPGMVTPEYDMTVQANYREHTLGQKIGDDLAVFGKKLSGFGALLTVGLFEGYTGLGIARLLISGMGMLAKLINPSDKAAQEAFARANEVLDLPSLGLLCTSEWAKGKKPEYAKPSDMLTKTTTSGGSSGAPPGTDPPTIERQLANNATLGLSTATLQTKSLFEAVKNYKLARQSPEMALELATKIPIKNKVILDGLKTTKFKAIKAGLGLAATVGTTIYQMVAEGPGVVWEDTAEQAWSDDNHVFEDCIQRQLNEALPDEVPPVDS